MAVSQVEDAARKAVPALRAMARAARLIPPPSTQAANAQQRAADELALDLAATGDI